VLAGSSDIVDNTTGLEQHFLPLLTPVAIENSTTS
jgi:hypothetical protein